MLYFRPGSHIWKLITMLSFVGELPFHSLYLLGNERVMKALVMKLTMSQTIRMPRTGAIISSRLLTVTGKNDLKTVRLYKGALPILEQLHSGIYRYYMDSFWNHRFPGDRAHRERNHRVAEAAMFCMRAGIEARPYLLPRLQNTEYCPVIPKHSVLYLARDIKKTGNSEMNKTMFTRMVGAVFCGTACYAVYNTRKAVMKWSGMGEFKALHSLIETGRFNYAVERTDSALLFGESEETALKTLLESDKSQRPEFRFDSIYRHIYFIPMDENGIRQLRVFTVPDFKEKLLGLLFEPDVRSYDKGFFEYDACIDGAYIFSHLDGDIARLLRFKEGVKGRKGKSEVICFSHQARFIREYLDMDIGIKIINIDQVEEELGLERRNLFGV